MRAAKRLEQERRQDPLARVEHALEEALRPGERPGGPPGLAAAVRHAVFPGGARVRPRLCLAVAMACGDDRPDMADAAAASIELLHCASLVHDDLPCFDDAPTRRGRPSVHSAYGERLAVLAGDALIVRAFQVLGLAAGGAPERLPALLGIVGESVGMPFGIVAGQAWECERVVDLETYQRGKTGSLFSAATAAGAVAAGADGAAWYGLGDRLGEAYQVADDIRDVAGNAAELGKPVGRDAALGRPSAVAELGINGALERFEFLVSGALEAIPPCAGGRALAALMLAEARRLLPRDLMGRTRVGHRDFAAAYA
jgi:geranylgeranyl diphosphate synthase type II